MSKILSNWPARLGVGLAAGAAIVYVDNWAFEGEVSPIIIVALLLAATAMAGALWGGAVGLPRPSRGRACRWLMSSSVSSTCRTPCIQHLSFHCLLAPFTLVMAAWHWLRNFDP